MAMNQFLPALAVAVGLTMTATPLTWDLRSGSSTPVTSSGSGIGNVFSFSSSGVTVTVTSWGLTGNGGTQFQAGATGRWSAGVGVCNAAEGANCGSPQHQVDNSGSNDFLLIQFSATVIANSIRINPYGVWDSDVTYFFGTAASPLNLTGKTLSDLAGLGFGSATHDLSSPSDNARTVTFSAGPVNSILFGARLSGGDTSPDYFKVEWLKGTVSPVPEPATMALLGAALVTIGLARRRSA